MGLGRARRVPEWRSSGWRMSRVCVIGAGAWGTALSIQAHRAGCSVTMVARDSRAAREIAESRSSKRLASMPIPDGIAVTDHVDDWGDLVVWAVPMQQLRTSVMQFRPRGAAMLVCCKGVEAGTQLLALEVIEQVLGHRQVAILSGPNFAREIALGLPAATVVASHDQSLREFVKLSLGSGTFRLYGNGDPIGVQLCGAAKNVIAIAAGAVIGAGLGENARAALVTRSLSELRRLIVGAGGHPDTVTGLAGFGDLMLTCAGPTSRNFAFGLALGAGQAIPAAVRGGAETIEGRATATALVQRAGAIELPICQAVSDLLEGVKTLEEVVETLLSRPQRDE